jgi:hypothetical protein
MKERFKFVNVGEQTYVFDKIIFRTIILFSVLFFVFVWFISGSSLIGSNLHIVCKSPSMVYPLVTLQGCENPVYQQYQYIDKLNIPRELYDQEFLPYGYEINKPSVWIKLFPICFFLFILFGFVINHLLNNKGFSFKVWIKGFEIDDK